MDYTWTISLLYLLNHLAFCFPLVVFGRMFSLALEIFPFSLPGSASTILGGEKGRGKKKKKAKIIISINSLSACA